MKYKYTKSYFLKENERGEPCCFGAEGADLFKQNSSVLRNAEQSILNHIDFSSQRVLELGYGRGEYLRYALNMGASVAIGVDFSEDAYSIARDYLELNGFNADIYCAEALEFLTNIDKYIGCSDLKFDVVLVLDFIEHVPRKEMSLILYELKKHFSDNGVIVINTPVFAVDNDVISEGLKLDAKDSSDEHEETAGMHCNRYTKESLNKYMGEHGFSCVTGHYFILNQCENTVRASQPLIFNVNEENEIYETAIRLNDDEVYQPNWHKIQGGILKERFIFLDTKDGCWQSEYVEGTHDKIFFEYLKKRIDLKGKTVFDIGAHIGHHTMCFANLVGEFGKVFSFEPNPSNIDRMNIILSRNQDLANRISVNDLAISNSNGSAVFVFSESIDNGYSSGSFLEGVNTPYSREDYEKMNFRSMHVETCALNTIKSRINWSNNVDVVKIDVEGAESLIIESANSFLQENRPILLMELHSIDNTTQVIRCLWETNYEIELLSFENENRLFIAACPDEICSVHTPAQFRLSNEMLKLYIVCVEKKNRRIEMEHSARMTLESEKAALESEKAALESEKAALESEKAALESEKAALERRYKYFEQFRKCSMGRCLIWAIKKIGICK